MKDLYWKAIWHAAGGEPDTDDTSVRCAAIDAGRAAILNMTSLDLLELISDLFEAEDKSFGPRTTRRS